MVAKISSLSWTFEGPWNMDILSEATKHTQSARFPFIWFVREACHQRIVDSKTSSAMHALSIICLYSPIYVRGLRKHVYVLFIWVTATRWLINLCYLEASSFDPSRTTIMCSPGTCASTYTIFLFVVALSHKSNLFRCSHSPSNKTVKDDKTNCLEFYSSHKSQWTKIHVGKLRDN